MQPFQTNVMAKGMRLSDGTGKCFTTVQNTGDNTVRAGVTIKKYNNIAYVIFQNKNNGNNSLVSGNIVAVGHINRHPAAGIFYYIHEGVMKNYKTGATIDSNNYEIIQ